MPHGLTTEEYLRLQVFNCIYKSPSNRRYYEDTVLLNKQTVRQLMPQLDELETENIITRKLIIIDNPPYQLIQIVPENPITERLKILVAQILAKT